ncbi:MAG: hypothetical protein IMZ75_14450, partial [Actinobacteria bacterium]|nr:hypothetical protein [Actinomycetota bacterium]
MSKVLTSFDRFPAEKQGDYARWMWAGAWASLLIGLIARVAGSGFAALWAFAVFAVFLALAFPFP